MPSRRFAWAALAAFAFLFHLGAVGGDYHLDSWYRIADNPALRDPRTLWRAFVDPSTNATLPHLVQYRPVAVSCLTANVLAARALGVEERIALRVGQALLQALLVLAAASFARRLAGSLGRRPEEAALLGLLAGSVVALHPVATLAVVYLAARDLQLMMLFGLLALAAFLRHLESGSVRWLIASSVLALLSFLSKTNGAAVPAIAALAGALSTRGPARRLRSAARGLAVGFFPFAGFLWVRYGIGFSDYATLDPGAVSPIDYFVSELGHHVFSYLPHLVWPFSMRPLPDAPHYTLADPEPWVGGFVLAVAVTAALLWARRLPLFAFAVLGGLLWMAPTSSIVPLRSEMTDYRQAPALLCIAPLVAAGLERLVRPGGGRFFAGVLLGWLAVGSAFTMYVWRTEESLWAHAVKMGTSCTGRLNYARTIWDRRPDEAERQLRLALEECPDHVYVLINLGMLLLDQGRREEGLAAVERAVAVRPDWALTHYWRAQALLRLGRREAALDAARKAVRIEPRNARYRALLERLEKGESA